MERKGTFPVALKTPKKVKEVKYLLNDAKTLDVIYGEPILDWDTDFSTIQDIRSKSKNLSSINPAARFQERTLHPDYSKDIRSESPFKSTVPAYCAKENVPKTSQLKLLSSMQLPTAQLPTYQLPTYQLPTAQSPKLKLAAPLVQLPTAPISTSVRLPTSAQLPQPKLPSSVSMPFSQPKPATPKLPVPELPSTQPKLPFTVHVPFSQPKLPQAEGAKLSTLSQVKIVQGDQPQIPQLKLITPTKTQISSSKLATKPLEPLEDFETQFSKMSVSQTPRAASSVSLPIFKTKVEAKAVQIKRPAIAMEEITSVSVPSQAENIITILSNIDPEKMSTKRAGKHSSGYSLSDLKQFAQQLGLPISGKSKQALVDEITNMRKERGLEV